jgi:hypothetical protein
VTSFLCWKTIEDVAGFKMATARSAYTTPVVQQEYCGDFSQVEFIGSLEEQKRNDEQSVIHTDPEIR